MVMLMEIWEAPAPQGLTQKIELYLKMLLGTSLRATAF